MKVLKVERTTSVRYARDMEHKQVGFIVDCMRPEFRNEPVIMLKNHSVNSDCICTLQLLNKDEYFTWVEGSAPPDVMVDVFPEGSIIIMEV